MMHIHGIGIISSVGRGLDIHREALTGGFSTRAKEGFHRVSDENLKDPILAKEARRADRFDRMAILAGLDALRDAGIRTEVHPSKAGLILATGLGPHVTTFRFLDDIINFKERDVSPTLFSHSVHNAAVSYLSLLAGIRGPTLTVTRFSFAFTEALNLARSWLEQKRCEHVLIGSVDELGTVMEKVLSSRASEDLPLGEGSVFFVLSQTPSERGYGLITSARDAEDLALSKGVSTAALFGRQPCVDAFSRAVLALLSDGRNRQGP